MRPGPLLRRILERAPLALFLLALAVGLVAYGVAIERYGLFPKSIIDDAARTARTTAESLTTTDTGAFKAFPGTALADFPDRRIEFVGGGGDSLASAMLVSGGRHQFREWCPEHGCLAVAISPTGEVMHAWPFRPNAIHAANIVDENDYPYELNNFSVERDMLLARIEQVPDGDLLITFHLKNAFPYAGGVARIGPDGYPRWFRRDYSHHQPRLVDGDIALVPALTVGDDTLEFRLGDDVRTHSCNRRIYRSVINVLNGDGALLERIPILDILLASPWSGILAETLKPCDPLHLNSIDIAGEDASGGIAAGDLVLSFREVSAFAILDGDTRELKRMVRGSFRLQHDVTHLTGSTFLMFDNHGAERFLGASRLLMVDLAAGSETTIFPKEDTPEALRALYSGLHGSIDLSPDRQRVAVAFPNAGVAVEVRLADGEVLAVFRSLHDVSDLEQFPDERLEMAARFNLFGVYYPIHHRPAR